ncbi:MAG: endo-1,4-beta-xylanase [Oscillospiraceae bacterium]|nr:endo-1,4-beta-xylanase [Oscillospiraceae bacterium]
MKKNGSTMRLVAFLTMLTLIVVTITPGFQPASAVWLASMQPVDFEDGTTMGFEGRDEEGIEVLTVTDEIAHSGTYSLLTTGRTKGWHGPTLRVEQYVQAGAQYTISVMVHAKTPDTAHFRLSTQIGQGSTAFYHNITRMDISVEDGWVEMTGTYVYPEDEFISIYIESDTADAEFYIDDVEFFTDEGAVFTHDPSLPSLFEIYKEHFLIGSAFTRADLSGPRFELIKHHFNVMTAENAMKPIALTGSEKGEITFEGIDPMLAELEKAGIPVIGHTLVWHSQSRDWLNKDANGEPLTREQARENMQVYISTVAEHFASSVIAWDVVNEAFKTSVGRSAASDWRSGLRNWSGASSERSAWFAAYANGANEAEGESGADYIYDAFVFTRLADPNAVLYYNDFNETEAIKREAIAAMTEEFNEKWKDDPRNTDTGRLLIEGLGLQAHYWTDSLDPKDVEDTIIRWKSTGAELSITELDIPAGSYNNYKKLDDDEEKKQATFYAELFILFKKYSDDITRVTIWGLDDSTSWRSGGSPLLFNANGTAKLAFFAVTDPEGFLEGKYDGSGPADDEPGEAPPPASEPDPATPATPPPEQERSTEQTDNTILTVISVLMSITALAAVVAAGIVLKKGSGKK